MKTTTIISFILVLIGAIVWLFVGIFGINLVELIFGSLVMVSNLIYILVGIAAIWLIFYWIIRRPFEHV